MDTVRSGGGRVRPNMKQAMLKTLYLALGFMVARYIFKRQPMAVDVSRLRRAGL